MGAFQQQLERQDHERLARENAIDAANEGLVYPWGSSPVYYIGEARSLAARLSDHSKHTKGTVDDHDAYWRQRYQYAAAFGAHAVWYLAGKVEPKHIENELMLCFYDALGAKPVANG